MKIGKRLMALLLCVLMFVTMLPVSALAAEDEDLDGIALEQEEEEPKQEEKQETLTEPETQTEPETPTLRSLRSWSATISMLRH